MILVGNVNGFNAKLLAQILNDSAGKENVVYSPVSLYVLLCMVAIGTKGGTAEELARLLSNDYSELMQVPRKDICTSSHFLREWVKAASSRLTTVSKTNNKIFYSHELIEEYSSLIDELFRVEMEHLSFDDPHNAAKVINEWIRAKTENIITNAIDPASLSAATNFVMVNTIFFKSSWKQKFDTKRTKVLPFYREEQGPVDVPMMTMKSRFLFYETESYSALFLPYENEDIFGVCILPSKNSSIREMLLNHPTLLDVKCLREKAGKAEVQVYLPAFKMEKLVNAKEVLMKLNVSKLFDSAQCDLSSATQQSTFISDIFHSASIEVNEDGVVAAAATVVIANLRMASTPPAKVFNANRAFLFIVHEMNSDLPLFTTVVTNPKK